MDQFKEEEEIDQDLMVSESYLENEWNIIYQKDTDDDLLQFCDQEEFVLGRVAAENLVHSNSLFCKQACVNELSEYKEHKPISDISTLYFVNDMKLYSGSYILVIGRTDRAFGPIFWAEIFRQGCYDGGIIYTDYNSLHSLIVFIFNQKDTDRMLTLADSPCPGLDLSFRRLWLMQIISKET